jgi:Lar family restriction alleviation protein
MAELKQCPFCGCTDIRIARDTEAIIERYRAICFECSAQMHRGTPQEVTEAWNRRAEDGK